MSENYDPDYFFNANARIVGNSRLRDPQIQAYLSVKKHFSDGNTTDAIVVIPTGVGKTGVMAILPYNWCHGRVLIITPRIVIKDTVLEALRPDEAENFWQEYGVFEDHSELPVVIEYKSGVKDEYLSQANYIILNIHRLQRHLDSSLINRLPADHFDLIIIDEAHHSPARTWFETTEYFSTAKVVKLTGTPFRTDERPISGELVYKYKLSRAMANGYVKSLENLIHIPNALYLTIDKDESKKYTVDEIFEMGLADEEWVSRSVAYSEECSRMIARHSLDILNSKKIAGAKLPHKIIATCCSIFHADQVGKIFEALGARVAIVHSQLDEKDRETALRDVDNHRVDVVINVAMLGEGYDHPYLSIAAIFRPFRSHLPYVQFVGRVLRVIPSSKNPSAEDNVASIISHKNMYLDKLWEFYKAEIEESNMIKEIEVPEDAATAEGLERGPNDMHTGSATEYGPGLLMSETYLTTEILERREQERRDFEQKTRKIMETLGIPEEQAARVVRQAASQKQVIKNPVAYETALRTEITSRINEEIIPGILARNGINARDKDLEGCERVFGGSHSWIKGKGSNDAMLAIYFRDAMKRKTGKPIEKWSIPELEDGKERLEKLEEFVDSAIREFRRNR